MDPSAAQRRTGSFCLGGNGAFGCCFGGGVAQEKEDGKYGDGGKDGKGKDGKGEEEGD